MGLDMYLKKKIFVGANYEHRNVTGSVDISVEGSPVKVNFKRLSYIEEQVGYWRKANHIHRWFVENVQGGKDDCREYSVSVEQLEQLLKDCKKIKATIVDAPEVLPTQDGFFFGSTDYDEYYWQDIDNTIEIIEAILEEDKGKGDRVYTDYYYQSSW